jgi:hypothetical protein
MLLACHCNLQPAQEVVAPAFKKEILQPYGLNSLGLFIFSYQGPGTIIDLNLSM